MKKSLGRVLIWLIFPVTAFAVSEENLRQAESASCFIKRQKEENYAMAVEALYLTSSLTNTFSNETFFLNNLEHNLQIFNQKSASVSPGYDLGYTVAFHYRAPLSRNSLELKYTYLHNDGTNQLKRTVTNEDGGISQRNQQNDWGHLHTHLHSFDAVIGHGFRLFDYLLLKLFGGMTVDDFHYFFTLKNQDVIVNTSLETNEVTARTLVNVCSTRRFRFCGWGSKVGLNFGYHFLSPVQPHEFSLYSSFQFAILFAHKWGRGGYSGEVFASQNLMQPVTQVLPLHWRDERIARLIFHMELDFSARYRYRFKKTGSLSLIAGFRLLAYTDLDEVNRVVTYNLETLAPVPPRTESDVDSMSFSGPYVGFSVAF